MSKKNRNPQAEVAVAVEVEVPQVEVAAEVAAEPKSDGLAPLVRRSIVPEGYRERCVVDKENKTASGNVSVHCGDELAVFLRGKSLEQVFEIAARAFGTGNGLKAKYAHLNVGQQRMNVGNRIRAAIKDGHLTVEQLKAAQ